MRTAAQTDYQMVAIANACFGSLLTMNFLDFVEARVAASDPAHGYESHRETLLMDPMTGTRQSPVSRSFHRPSNTTHTYNFTFYGTACRPLRFLLLGTALVGTNRFLCLTLAVIKRLM